MPPIDHDFLAEQTGGDPALARECLGLFADQCRRLMPGLTDPSLSTDARADLAHTLKGSALGVGAVAVARTSAALETGLRAGQDGDPSPLVEAVAAVLRAIPDE